MQRYTMSHNNTTHSARLNFDTDIIYISIILGELSFE